MASESEFPDGALPSALENSNSLQKGNIISAIERSGRDLSEAVVTVLMGILERRRENFGRQDGYSLALGAMRTQSALPTVKVLLYLWVALNAIKLIRGGHFSALVGMLGDKYRAGRYMSVASILENQSSLSEVTIAALAKLIANEQSDRRAREAAAISLKRGNCRDDDRSTTAETEANSSEPVIVELFAENPTESTINLLATKAMKHEENLSEAAIAACVWLVENAHRIQYDVLRHLKPRPRYLEESSEDIIFTALVRIIKNERGHYPKTCLDKAANILGENRIRSSLETSVTTLLEPIVDEHAAEGVGYEATEFLVYQETPRERSARLWARLVEAKSSSKRTQQLELPETVAAALVRPCEDETENKDIRKAAAHAIIGNQMKLSRGEVIAALVKLIENENEATNTRFDAIEILGQEPIFIYSS
ncbi:hypothetical protein GGS24DRAFT_507560 [Hypoxylon argillaceum]|nr:hypothetical protein GGS24DRAFT_507560 [Hypoxylon argillaceum]